MRLSDRKHADFSVKSQTYRSLRVRKLDLRTAKLNMILHNDPFNSINYSIRNTQKYLGILKILQI